MTAAKLRHKKREADKRRKTSSLFSFRKLSNKRASAEMAGMLSASSSLQSLKVSCDWWMWILMVIMTSDWLSQDGAPCLVSPGPGSSRLHSPSPLSESPGSSSPGEMTLGADTSSNLSSPATQTPIAQGTTV